MGRRTKKKKKNTKLKVFIAIFLLTIIIASGVVTGVKIFENGGGLKGLLATILGEDTRNVSNVEPITVLLLGISEDLDSRLTDTIMVCSYNPKTQRASMLSIPRDTFIGDSKTSVGGYDKINSVYSRSGAKGTIREVEDIIDKEIDYYAVVNTKALINIVDIIGEEGMQLIDGEKAEQLLRFRHNNDGSTYPQEYGDNDYGRMRTQREFIKETVKQTLQIKNITKANKIISAVFENIETNLDEDAIKQYIPYVHIADEDIILLAEKDGKEIGFIFCIPDFEETKRGEKISTIIVKTVAVIPEFQNLAIGNVLMSDIAKIAKQKGFKNWICAFMYANNTSQKMAKRNQTELMREYALYGKKI